MQGYDEWLWAFFELSNDRSIGMALGPIPSSSISAWSDGWPYDERVMFRTCIREMDAVYLGQSKTGSPAAKPPPAVDMGPDLFKAMFGKS